jgi:hypothetical protein
VRSVIVAASDKVRFAMENLMMAAAPDDATILENLLRLLVLTDGGLDH